MYLCISFAEQHVGISHVSFCSFTISSVHTQFISAFSFKSIPTKATELSRINRERSNYLWAEAVCKQWFDWWGVKKKKKEGLRLEPHRP